MYLCRKFFSFFLSFSICHCYTIVDYPGLAAFYAIYKHDYYERNGIDLFAHLDLESVKNYCNLLMTSRTYKMLKEDDLVPLPEAYLNNTAQVDADPFECEGLTFMAEVLTYLENDSPEMANLYSCPVIPQSNFPQLYISYGFKEDLFYLFMREYNSNKIEFKGLVELTPFLDQQSNVQSLEMRFIMGISSNYVSRRYNIPIVHVPASEDPLCQLNDYQKFRLCSLVDDARRSWQDRSILEKNWVRHSPNLLSCVTNQRLWLRTFEEKADIYNLKEIYINVTPCAINATQRISFYLTRTFDSVEKESVFVLKEVINRRTLEIQGYEIQERVTDISVLKYMSYL